MFNNLNFDSIIDKYALIAFLKFYILICFAIFTYHIEMKKAIAATTWFI